MSRIQHPTHPPLSPEGAARRDRMLLELQDALRARARRRTILRTTAVALPALALAIGTILAARVLLPAAPPDRTDPIASESNPVPTPAAPAPERAPQLAQDPAVAPATDTSSWNVIPRARITHASRIGPTQGDAALLQEARYRGSPPIRTISDDELARTLRLSGHAAGVVQTPEGTRILPDQPPTEGPAL